MSEMAIVKKVSKKRKAVSRKAEAEGHELNALWAEAHELENQLERELLEDAVKSARQAIEELHAETKTQPWERRRGLRLREKAERVERAFNRLRALRKGDLLPERHPDD